MSATNFSQKEPNKYIPNRSYILSTLFEMGCTLILIHIPILLQIVYIKTDPINKERAFLDIFLNNFKHGDVFAYIAGILATTTVWFIIHADVAKHHPRKMVFLILAPVLLMFFSAPVYFRQLNGGEGGDFTTSYIQVLLFLCFSIWILSLYQQRSISDVRLTNPSDRINEIKDGVKEPEV